MPISVMFITTAVVYWRLSQLWELHLNLSAGFYHIITCNTHVLIIVSVAISRSILPSLVVFQRPCRLLNLYFTWPNSCSVEHFGVVVMVRALDWRSRGCRFESWPLHHNLHISLSCASEGKMICFYKMHAILKKKKAESSSNSCCCYSISNSSSSNSSSSSSILFLGKQMWLLA